LRGLVRLGGEDGLCGSGPLAVRRAFHARLDDEEALAFVELGVRVVGDRQERSRVEIEDVAAEGDGALARAVAVEVARGLVLAVRLDVAGGAVIVGDGGAALLALL